MIGTPQIRQVRVKLSNECSLGLMFSSFSKYCFPAYSPSHESKGYFNTTIRGSSSAVGTSTNADGTTSAIVQTSLRRYPYTVDSSEIKYSGKASTYNAGGYSVLMPLKRAEAIAELDVLRSSDFIDFATRAVFVDFTIWNFNTGEYAVAKLLFEITATDLVLPSLEIFILPPRSLVFTDTRSSADTMAMISDIIFYICFAGFVFEILWDARAFKLGFFKYVCSASNFLLQKNSSRLRPCFINFDFFFIDDEGSCLLVIIIEWLVTISNPSTRNCFWK
jgi:hypothetical protein